MNTKFSRYIYPSAIILIITTIVLVFVFSAMFITNSIDIALLQEQNNVNEDLLVQMSAYQNASEKLTLSTSSPKTIEIISTSTPINTEEEKKPEENKSLLAIAVLNSTGIKGKAAELSTQITDLGFKVSFTGNAPKREPITLIKIKESSKKIFPNSITEINKIVGITYKVSEIPLEDSSEYDLVIVIGSQ